MTITKTALLGLVLTASCGFATTINFDDLDTRSGDLILDSLNTYQGFTWTDFSAYSSVPGFPGFDSGIVSSPNAAYTSGDESGFSVTSSISSQHAFDLISAKVGAGWYNGLIVTVDGLYGGVQQYSKTLNVNATGEELYAFNFNSIDTIQISSTVTSATTDPYGCGVSECSQVTIDDLELTFGSEPPIPTTPEPATSGLVVASMLLVAIRRTFQFVNPDNMSNSTEELR